MLAEIGEHTGGPCRGAIEGGIKGGVLQFFPTPPILPRLYTPGNNRRLTAALPSYHPQILFVFFFTVERRGNGLSPAM